MRLSLLSMIQVIAFRYQTDHHAPLCWGLDPMVFGG